MKNLKIVLIAITSLSFNGFAQAGEKGNGGDFIRQVFIERGKQIVAFLEKNEKEFQFFGKNKINVQALKGVFDIKIIQVSAEPLLDNLGSSVDAIGIPGKLVLNQPAWQTYILKGIGLDRMILHESLRAIGKNDDNYVISERAPELPSTYDKNSVPTGYRLVREEFSEAHFPSDAELDSLVKSHFACETFSWNDKYPTSGSADLEFWHSKALKFIWGRDEGQVNVFDLLYIDKELQSVSGFVSENVRATMLTRTGKEFITEVTDASIGASPTAVSNQSLHAHNYVYCESKGSKTE